MVENGIKYVVCPEDGQKTGFYCDQRDNRMMIRGISKGKTVLDTFCYSGGFSVNAAAGEEHSLRIVLREGMFFVKFLPEFLRYVFLLYNKSAHLLS